MELQISPKTAALLMIRLSVAKSLRSVAERRQRSMRRIFMNAVRDTKAIIPLRSLIQSMSFGHSGTGAPLYILEPAIQSFVDQLLGDSSEPLTSQHVTYSRFLRAKEKVFPTVLSDTMQAGIRFAAQTLGVSFDTANPEAIAWAENHAGQLVREIAEDTRDGIRLIVTQGIELGISPHDVADTIKSDIGLTSRDVRAVMNRQLKDLADGVESRIAKARAERYAAKLLAKRANDIAITETMKAASEGQRKLWSDAIRRGLIKSLRKTLIQVDPCTICAPMVGEIVEIDQDFSGGLPPFHVRCQCVEGLVN